MTEDQLFPRPPPTNIQATWTELFSNSLISLSRLRAAGLSKGGLGEASADGGIILRSVYWRFYFGLLPPPTSLDLFPPSLQSSRTSYSALRARYLVAPDGRWADDCSPPEDSRHTTSSSSSSSRSKSPPTPSTAGGWDPLSLDEESPWKAWYAQLDLRKTILQDVDRTFPDIPYFTIDRVKRSLVTILFLFSMLNPDVGYRQGMHELLAVCLMTVDRDSLVNKQTAGVPLGSPNSGSKTSEAMYATLDRAFIEHDAFELFNAIMKSAKSFYEWRAEEGPRSKITSPTVQAPIIMRCHNLQSNLIRRIDPQLWERFETEGVEVQIWAIRWIRLIFTRELPFPLALKLWDGIFAEDSGLQIIDYICLAMLLLIRNELLDADHAGLLTNLLRYPSPSPTYPFSPFLILSQALSLRNSITPATGVEVVIQNQEILGVNAQPPDRPPEPQITPRGPGNMRGRPPVAVKGYQSIAAGLFERAQAAGFDKAIMSTVADIRRNIPDSAYSYLPNLPFSPVHTAQRDSSGTFSSIPSLSAIPRSYHPSQVPPLDQSASTDSIASIKSLRDAERELAELRLAMVGMGKAMSEWLERLPSTTGQAEKGGLERVKETLLDAAVKDVDEIVKEWGWHEGLESRSRDTTPGPEEGVETAEGIAVGEITPTPPVVEQLQPPAELPSPGIRSTPSPTTAAGPSQGSRSGRLPLYLSNREDRPMPGLPRSPVTAPPGSRRQGDVTGHASSGPVAAPQRDGIKGSRGGESRKGVSGAEDEGGNGDPLAGLGVRAVPPENGRKVVGGLKGVDPLLGMGVR